MSDVFFQISGVFQTALLVYNAWDSCNETIIRREADFPL